MKIRRSFVFGLAAVMMLLAGASQQGYAQRKAKKAAQQPVQVETSTNCYGYYKDVFMDSGINVNSLKDLPAARFIGASWEAFISAPHSPMQLTLRDTLLQREMICGSEMDENGILLYPDGEPRFRVIYMNGGKATAHGRSLTLAGRSNMQQFIKNGGSYVGTCAGAYIASMGTIKKGEEAKPNDQYLNIWPGAVRGTALLKNHTAMSVEPGSPLLKYYQFGGDMRVDSLRHNGGCFAYYGEGQIIPDGTEILMRYIYDTVSVTSKSQIHNEVASWAWKENKLSGRVVVTGSHPEDVVAGERLEYMASMLLYAMDGNGNATVKGELVPGQVRQMNKSAKENDPAFTAVGDRQYHHFTVEVPAGCKKAEIVLEGKGDFDLTLLANCGDFAFHKSADAMNLSRGASKKLVLDNPAPGKWYVSVFCETTVDSRMGKYGTEYYGRTDVLNGVPYSLKVELK